MSMRILPHRTRIRDAAQMAEQLRRRGIPVELRHETDRPRHEKYRPQRVSETGPTRGTASRWTVTPSSSTTARPRDAVQMAEQLRRRGIPVELRLRHEKHRPRHEKYRLRRVWETGPIRGTFSRRTVTPSTSTTARTRTAARTYAVRTGSAAARAHRQVLTGAGRRTAPRGDDPSAAVETIDAAAERFFGVNAVICDMQVAAFCVTGA